jgi:hypothetical protein
VRRFIAAFFQRKAKRRRIAGFSAKNQSGDESPHSKMAGVDQ